MLRTPNAQTPSDKRFKTKINIKTQRINMKNHRSNPDCRVKINYIKLQAQRCKKSCMSLLWQRFFLVEISIQAFPNYIFQFFYQFFKNTLISIWEVHQRDGPTCLKVHPTCTTMSLIPIHYSIIRSFEQFLGIRWLVIVSKMYQLDPIKKYDFFVCMSKTCSSGYFID